MIDFNCPYSYIGLERLKKACEKLDIDTEWEFKPFELEPLTGKRPLMSTAERYAEKHEIALEDALDEISEIEEIAADEGLKINYRDMPLTSSKDALRLCKFCQNIHPEITLRLVEEIFHSRLVENKNIADIKVLHEIAVSCGIEESEASKILENNYYNIEIYLDQEEAVSYGINATPCFILSHKGERLIVPGVFSAEEFENALEDMISGKIEEKTFV